MATLAEAVDAGETDWLVSAGITADFLTVESETVAVLTHFPVQLDPQTRLPLPPRIRVQRGAGGTTAASHADGTTLTPLIPPAASGNGGGGGAIAVDNTVDPPAEVATLIAPGADLSTPGEATLGKWTAVGATDETVDLSTSVTVSGGLGVGKLNRSVTGTDSAAGTEANTTVTSEGDAEANTTVTVTGIEDGLAKTTVNTVSGSADVSIAAHATDVAAGNAFASSSATSAGGGAQAKSTADAQTTGTGDATSEASTADGTAIVSSIAYASGSGNATVNNDAVVDGAGLATAGISATGTGGTSGVVALADATSARMGFNGTTPIAKPTGVAVTAEGIHAALVSLGLIAA